jgi:hypothetical protein
MSDIALRPRLPAWRRGCLAETSRQAIYLGMPPMSLESCAAILNRLARFLFPSLVPVINKQMQRAKR